METRVTFWSKDPRWIKDDEANESEIAVTITIKVLGDGKFDYEAEDIVSLDRSMDLVLSDLSAADQAKISDLASDFIEDRGYEAQDEENEAREWDKHKEDV